MLSNAFEWESVVHPSPTNEMISTRTAIVKELLSAFDEEEDIDTAMRLVSAAMTGLNTSIQADAENGLALIEFTRQYQPAISSKVSENALDLQLTACLAVGEILTRIPNDETWQEPLFLVAGLTLSANLLWPPAAGPHLTAAQVSLAARARSVLAEKATAIRQRPKFNLANIDRFSATGDLESFWVQLKPILKTGFESLSRSSAIDRDELEVLWWLYNDNSDTFSKKLSELNPFETALASSLELVDRALCPPPATLKNIIHGLVARVAQKPKPVAKGIKAIIGAWTPEIVAVLSPKEDEVKEQAQAFPKLLPLTWISSRVSQSGVVAGWEQEFEAKTGLSAGYKLAPDALVEQIFAERTSQRLLLPFCGE
ncbi:MAG: GTPase-associated system all-helical protein GASH [Planctomycetota bacterium]